MYNRRYLTGGAGGRVGFPRTTLASFDDVDIQNPQAGEAIVYNGTKWENAVIPGGGNSNLTYFLDDTTGSVPGYKTLATAPQALGSPAVASATVNAGTSPVQMEQWISPSLNRVSIPGGVWVFTLFSKVSVTADTTRIRIVVSKADTSGAPATTLFTVESEPIDATTLHPVEVVSVQPAFAGFLVTDKLKFELYAVTDHATDVLLTVEYGSLATESRFDSPLIINHDDLPGIDIAGSVKLHMPTLNAGGDLSGTYPNPSINAHGFTGAKHTSGTLTDMNALLSDGDVISTLPGEFSSKLPNKAIPTISDQMVIEDTADGLKKKYTTLGAAVAASPSVGQVKTSAADGTLGYLVAKLEAGMALAVTEDASVPADRRAKIDVQTGNTGSTVCVGNDARLSDARVPLAHASTHAAGGSDPTAIAVAANASSHYTGFPNRTDSTLSWDYITRILTISGTFDVYNLATKYTPTAPQKTITIPNVTGLYWIWYTFPGGVPTLNYSTSAPGFDKCLVATIYWNAAAGVGFMGDERHFSGRDSKYHEYLHLTRGTRYATGLSPSFTDTTFSITPGSIYDEELPFSILAATTCAVFYMNGSTAWVWDTPSTTPYKLSGTPAIMYNNGTAIADVPISQYVAYFIFATNSADKPLMSFMGQRVDTTLANCRANATPANLSLGVLPSAEMKLLYRVIYHRTGGGVVFDEFTDYRADSATVISGFAVADHAALTNLNYLTAGHTGFYTQAPAEISSTTLKATPTVSDMLLIEDAADSNNKKRVTAGSLLGNAALTTGYVPYADAANKLANSALRYDGSGAFGINCAPVAGIGLKVEILGAGPFMQFGWPGTLAYDKTTPADYGLNFYTAGLVDIMVNGAIFSNHGLGLVGIGIGANSPTAILEITGGQSVANKASLKIGVTSGLLAAPESGAIERTNDNLHFTINTGTARKGIVLDDGTRLTSGTIPKATTNGRLMDSANTEAQVSSAVTNSHATTVQFNKATAGEINALTAVTPDFADKVLIEDASDSFNKKGVLLSDLMDVSRSMFYPADAFYNPQNSNWTVNLLAPLSLDGTNPAIMVRAFDDDSEEGVGISNFYVPPGATNLVCTIIGRPNSTENGTSVRMRFYGRDMGNGTAVGSWSAAQNYGDFTMQNDQYYRNYSHTYTLSSLNLVAGRMGSIEITRDGTNDSLGSDFLVAGLKLSFT